VQAIVFDPMSTLVTGGGGCIGSELAEALLKPDHEVVALEVYRALARRFRGAADFALRCAKMGCALDGRFPESVPTAMLGLSLGQRGPSEECVDAYSPWWSTREPLNVYDSGAMIPYEWR